MRRSRFPLMVNGLRLFRDDDSGVLAVEFALMAPVLFIFLLAATDVALAIRAKMKLYEAARAAEAYAAIHGWDSAGIQNAATNATTLSVSAKPATFCACVGSGSVTQVACNTTCPASGQSAGTYVSTRLAGSYKPLFPSPWNSVLVGSYLNMNVTTVIRIQ